MNIKAALAGIRDFIAQIPSASRKFLHALREVRRGLREDYLATDPILRIFLSIYLAFLLTTISLIVVVMTIGPSLGNRLDPNGLMYTMLNIHPGYIVLLWMALGVIMSVVSALRENITDDEETT